MAISVLVAEDHQLVVGALRAAFARDADIEIVGDTQRGADVPALVEELRPDVLLLDLTMPDVDGFEVLRRLAERSTSVRGVVLSMHTTAAYAARAVKRGALGISRRTVETYLGSATEKLGIKARSELVRYAVRVGLVSTEGDES